MAGVHPRKDLHQRWLHNKINNPFARRLTNEQVGLPKDPNDIPTSSPEGHAICIVNIVNAERKSRFEELLSKKREVEKKNVRPWAESDSDSESMTDSDCDKPSGPSVTTNELKKKKVNRGPRAISGTYYNSSFKK